MPQNPYGHDQNGKDEGRDYIDPEFRVNNEAVIVGIEVEENRAEERGEEGAG